MLRVLCTGLLVLNLLSKAATASETQTSRKLHGRFLHITDIHPDPFYKFNADVKTCHGNKAKKGAKRAGYLGVPFSECDAPLTLVNLTFDYLEKEWASKVDFVLWTGDSARHDNDNKIPRTLDAIIESNRVMAERMSEVFGNIPIIPSIGNNDIWPHNVMAAGPSDIINKLQLVWRPYIPFSSYLVFQRGGYFAVEVILNRLAVISLNTIYWYDANKIVSGCDLHDQYDPGNLQFDWLEVQLMQFRERGMQVILSGHVPPTPGNYFSDCHFRYGQISIRYQDTIIGHFFGHMNIDHFFWLDVSDLGREPTSDYDALGSSLDDALKSDFKNLPKKSALHHDDYVIINVGPSVIPTYYPSFRIFQYNITDYLGPKVTDDQQFTQESWNDLAVEDTEPEEDDGPIPPKNAWPIHSTGKRRHGHRHPGSINCSDPENEEKRACRPWGPRHASPSSPSRTNTLWSLLGYAQFYLPDIAKGNETYKPKFKLEYTTFPISSLHPPNDTTLARTWIPPIPKHLLPHSLRNMSRTKSKYTPYRMTDLTIPSYITLARKLAKNHKLWKRFVDFMYMGAGEETDVWDEEDTLLRSHVEQQVFGQNSLLIDEVDN